MEFSNSLVKNKHSSKEYGSIGPRDDGRFDIRSDEMKEEHSQGHDNFQGPMFLKKFESPDRIRSEEGERNHHVDFGLNYFSTKQEEKN